MHQQVSDLFEFTGIRDIEDVVATVVQVIAGLADSAQCGVAGGDAGQCDGFLRLEACCLLFAHAALSLLLPGY